MRNEILQALDYVSEAATNAGDPNTVALIVQIRAKLAYIPDTLFIAAEGLYDAAIGAPDEKVAVDEAVEADEPTMPNE